MLVLLSFPDPVDMHALGYVEMKSLQKTFMAQQVCYNCKSLQLGRQVLNVISYKVCWDVNDDRLQSTFAT